MSTHPSDESLFAHASNANPEIAEHVAGCSSCASRAARLAVGQSLIEDARRASTPPVDWHAIDARVMAAAESTAAEIRRGALRPARRPQVFAYVGVALAAAAASVFIVRGVVTHRALEPVAFEHVGREGETPRVGASVPVTAANEWVVDGVVLLVAAPVSVTIPGAASEVLTSRRVVPAGSRVAATGRGRAVLALNDGFRVDARSGSELQIDRLTNARAELTLASGEARVDGPATETGRLVLGAGGWMLHAKGGAFVAKVENDVVRLSVLSGKVGISREGSPERDVLAGNEVELAKTDGSMRVVSLTAHDANEIDVGYLTRDGAEIEVPSTLVQPTVTVAGHPSLPTGVTGLRVAPPATVDAQSGGETWSVTVSSAHRAGGAAQAWRPSVRTATARASVATGVAAPTPQPAEPSAAVPGPAAVLAPASVPVVRAATISDSLRRTLSTQLAGRVGHCFTACAAAHSCGTAQIDVALETNHVARVEHVTGTLAECIAAEARSLTLPNTVISTQQLGIWPPQ